MKELTTLVLLVLFFMSCEKSDFSVENPNIEKFVQQIKNGSYDEYELNGKGEKLWTKMPYFKKEHIPLLIEFSKDTTLISHWDHFPLNPISSIPPHRVINDKSYIMLGEYLLWCAEGTIEGKTYASLTPILKNQNHRDNERLTGRDILVIRQFYQDWWMEFVKTNNTNKHPLEGSVYNWK